MSILVDTSMYDVVMSRYAELGDRIWDAIKDRDTTQEAVAEALDAGQSTVSGWVRGESRPRERQVAQVARLLGIPEDEFRQLGRYRRRNQPHTPDERELSELEQLLVNPRTSIAVRSLARMTPERQQTVADIIAVIAREESIDLKE